MEDKKRSELRKGIFVDVLIIMVILGCIVGIILAIFSKVNTDNVRNQKEFHISYVVDQISVSSAATIEFGDAVWLDNGTKVGTFQSKTLTESQLVLDTGKGYYVTVAYPDDNVRSMVGQLYTNGTLSSNNTLLLNGTVEVLPGQTLSVHTRYADFTLRVTAVECID